MPSGISLDENATVDGYDQLAVGDTDCVKHEKNEVYCSITYSGLYVSISSNPNGYFHHDWIQHADVFAAVHTG